MNAAFTPCQQAIIFDPETGIAHAYRGLSIQRETLAFGPRFTTRPSAHI